MDRPGALAAIGETPIMQLSRLAGPGAAEVWVKLEAANPTGSYKDRMALAMIEGAERRGTLRPGQCVVEYTGGSTGSSLALVCAVKGYPLRIVSSDAFAAEKLQTMAAFGADVELILSPDGITPELVPAMRRRAAEIVEQEGAFATDQFNNRDTVDGYRVIGEEILRQPRTDRRRLRVRRSRRLLRRRLGGPPRRLAGHRAHRRGAGRVRRPVRAARPAPTGSRAAAWGSSRPT